METGGSPSVAASFSNIRRPKMGSMVPRKLGISGGENMDCGELNDFRLRAPAPVLIVIERNGTSPRRGGCYTPWKLECATTATFTATSRTAEYSLTYGTLTLISGPFLVAVGVGHKYGKWDDHYHYPPIPNSIPNSFYLLYF